MAGVTLQSQSTGVTLQSQSACSSSLRCSSKALSWSTDIRGAPMYAFPSDPAFSILPEVVTSPDPAAARARDCYLSVSLSRSNFLALSLCLSISVSVSASLSLSLSLSLSRARLPVGACVKCARGGYLTHQPVSLFLSLTLSCTHKTSLSRSRSLSRFLSRPLSRVIYRSLALIYLSLVLSLCLGSSFVALSGFEGRGGGFKPPGALAVVSAQQAPSEQHVSPGYRGTSLIRKHPTPYDPHRALGMVLL